MKIPNPYFKNVPNIGDLKLEKIIVDYDYPILSVLMDKSNKRYLCLCFDVEESQQWLITYISTGDLIKLLTNKLMLSAPFKNSSSTKIYATYNYDSKLDSYTEVIAEKVLAEDLPANGEYLDAEKDEWIEYISVIQDTFSNASARTIGVSQIFKKIVVSVQENCSSRKVATDWNDTSRTMLKQERVPCLS